MTAVAYPVVNGRCGECGRQKPLWTPEAIVAALVAWGRDHDGRGPAEREWRRAGKGHPATQTVREVFGSLSVAFWLAGLEAPERVNTLGVWTRDEIVGAIYLWRFDTGRLPRAHEWARPRPGFPASATVRRHFGSWNAAIVAAGYEPTHARRSRASYRQVAGNAVRRGFDRSARASLDGTSRAEQKEDSLHAS